MLKTIALGALGGAGVGLVAGFLTAVLVLQLRRLRNARLMRRGEPPIRDCVLPPFHVPGVFFGVVLGGGLAWVLPLVLAIVIGGSAVPAGLLLLSGGFAVSTALGRRPQTPPPSP
ncbi:MAG: hypothetical protein KDK70_34030 [Myxococcales bacterium]|nr:hypothetical protein [Myxococcales bacterium]